ncbi:MAG: hypothetical protein JNJ43_03545 [Anaerolineales bacterium]|nr:hypothetical protein [Anaerolineales bacterium]
MESKKVFFEVVHCPIVKLVFESRSNHPCRKIIESQNISSLSEFQLPEPWNGQIESAPVLFLSSNPSIDFTEDYPTWSSSDPIIEDFFYNRFGGRYKEWVKDGKRSLKKDGSYSKAIKFWAEIQKRSEELFQREVIPGVDHVLSEIVHCKSRDEIGVDDAMDFCSTRYLKEILSISKSIVVVLLGDKANMVFKKTFNISDRDINSSNLVNVMNKERYVCFLPHPNARKKRKFESILSTEVLSSLRLVIQGL